MKGVDTGSEILILGCGGHAKSVSDSALAAGIGITGYVDDLATPEGFSYRGIGIIGSDADLPDLYTKGYRDAFIGVGYIGEGRIREQLQAQLTGLGFHLVSVIDPSAAIAVDVIVEDGVFIGKNAIINAAANLGMCAIINSGAIVEHECSIGDFTHISVGSVICGGVSIGKSCFIGANATVLPGLSIGDHSIVGAGAVVTKDIQADSIAVGVPAAARQSAG